MPAESLARASAAFMLLSLAGACNTMSGVGQDITVTSRFLQVYMPLELQGADAQLPAGGAISAVPRRVTAAPSGVPPLNGL